MKKVYEEYSKTKEIDGPSTPFDEKKAFLSIFGKHWLLSVFGKHRQQRY